METLASVVPLLEALADPSRVRLLALCEAHELSVAELVAVTGLAQSRVSTHLGRLREVGLVRARVQGAAAYHRLAALGEPARAVWAGIRERLDDPLLASDRARAEQVVRARRPGGFFEGIAGEMERHYSPGRTWEALAQGLLGWLRLGDVLDAGSGDGFVGRLLAPVARSVTCLDRNERLVEAARRRLRGVENARCVVGDLHALPFDPGAFDQVALLAVLTYSKTPDRALREAARVLRPGGDLVVTTLDAHAHLDATAPYGHVRPGFRPAALSRMLRRAGLEVRRCAVVGRERRAPCFGLVAAHAVRPAVTRRSRRAAA